MSILIGFIPLSLVGVLYAWYLRLGARWAQKTSLSWKLCFLYIVLIFVFSALLTVLFKAIGWTPPVIVGGLLHLIIGAMFFGKFGVGSDKKPLGLVGGLKITGIAMGLLLLTIGCTFAIIKLVNGFPGF